MTSVDCAILLYGSYARGDNDSSSDIDVLFIAESEPVYRDVSMLLPDSFVGPLHISHYTWSEFKAMSSYGSLFLHHIAKEAEPIQFYGNGKVRLSGLLASLPNYLHPERDLVGFKTTVSDAEHGLSYGLSPSFELAVLGGVARHASVLACFLSGAPSYGRQSIPHAAALLKCSDVSDDLEMAHKFRLFEGGQCVAPSIPKKDEVEHVVCSLHLFLDRMEGLIHGNNN